MTKKIYLVVHEYDNGRQFEAFTTRKDAEHFKQNILAEYSEDAANEISISVEPVWLNGDFTWY